jgi:hypothetical protein
MSLMKTDLHKFHNLYITTKKFRIPFASGTIKIKNLNFPAYADMKWPFVWQWENTMTRPSVSQWENQNKTLKFNIGLMIIPSRRAKFPMSCSFKFNLWDVISTLFPTGNSCQKNYLCKYIYIYIYEIQYYNLVQASWGSKFIWDSFFYWRR